MRLPTRRFEPGRTRLAVIAALLAVGALALGACDSNQQGSADEPNASQGGSQSSHTDEPDAGSTQVTVPGQTASGTDGSSGQGGTGSASGSTSESSQDAASSMRVVTDPAFGATDVSPNQPITVTALHATIAQVTMVGDDGSTVDGALGEGDRSWTSDGQLQYGVTYTISGDLTNASGATKPFDGTVATADPDDTMAAYIQIPNGDTVGIAAPIVVTFAGSVADRAAAEKRLHVTVTDENGNPLDVVGSWGWMADEDIQGNGVEQSRVHYRPKKFWPAHAQIHVEANLYGVNYGDGEWGRENITRDFNIGPKLIVRGEIDSHHLLVVKDDQVIRNYPVSYGKESIPGRNTVSGVHIVQRKNTDNPDGSFKMCNLAYGYCGVTEYWGVRINDNGEFIHVNKNTEKMGLLGKANISHGCVNMGMADGKEFYDMMYYGVPVAIKGTGVDMSWKDYVYDWAPMFMADWGGSWSNWTDLSAL